MNQLSLIFRELERKEKLNILTAPTHEAYESNLCKTVHNFYALSHPSFKTWNTDFRPVPENYTLLTGDGLNQLMPHIDIDLVLSQNKFGQFQVLAPIAHHFKIPLIQLEHTLPIPGWGPNMMQKVQSMNGNLNVFISEFSCGKWGYDPKKEKIVHHGIDTENFISNVPFESRNNQILSVVNDFINRDYCCNYQGWKRTTNGLPVKVLGSTPGLSEPAKSVSELISVYSSSRIFYNTSTVSPIPTALLEAMSCGCACVSTSTCMIPEIIEHGKDGFISNDEQELRKYLELLMNDLELARELGSNARKKVISMFSLDTFVKNWNDTFWSVLK